MKKRGFRKKLIGGVVMMALAVTSIVTPQPNMASAATSYYESNWSASGIVSVHDPSIITTIDENGETVYYIFGSHRAFAKSYDLKSWKTFQNNISTDFETLFKKEADWAKIGDPSYSLVGNLWAPDVIWNEDMGKWCMYMSINGRSWDSSICLLTADDLEGDWTYVGTIIYSGFTDKDSSHDYTLTDYQEVTGDTALADRYIGASYVPTPGCERTTWDTSYGAHAIDPCVFYDDDGTLWMTYGSWSGGIYMIELDKTTGLRDLSHKYETVANESDAYMGIHIAGGKAVSGEASYIQKIGDYYYLFMSYGYLTSVGGYNVRLFRSEEVTGPYVDAQGNPAIFTTSQNNIQGSIGQRLMAYYQWSWATYGEVAQGHNSAFVDADGKAYIIYHTRATNHGEEHKVRVHQLYQNENGWLVESPFSYTGETISPTGYSSDEIVGTYEVIFHEATSYTSKEANTGVDITLNEDGTVSCATNKAYAGTWKETDGSYYMTITLGSTVYHGVFTKCVVEGSVGQDETLCFTAVSDEKSGTDQDGICIWGARISDKLTTFLKSNLELTKTKVSIVKGNTKKIKVHDIDRDDTYLKKAVWTSSNKKVATVNSNGKITAKKVGTATITAKIGSKKMTCKVTVTKKTSTK